MSTHEDYPIYATHLPEEHRPRSTDEFLAAILEELKHMSNALDTSLAANTAALGNLTQAVGNLTALAGSAAPTAEQLATLDANTAATQKLADDANATVTAANPPAAEEPVEETPVEQTVEEPAS